VTPPHYCSTECAAAGKPCGLCIAQDQAATESRKRGNGKPTLTHNPFATLLAPKPK
jgi:hypothetical protein